MNIETIFTISNFLVLPFWALMTFLPHWQVTRFIIQSPWIVAPPALLYVLLAIPQLGGLVTAVSNPTLTGVGSLLAEPMVVTLAWAHFLAFDLFVGRWIYLDSRQKSISAWFIGPILYLTLMLGPVGLLSYLLLRPAIDYWQARTS